MLMALYKLVGVIVHEQLDKSHGHYKAFILSRASNQWIFVNDSQVFKLKKIVIMKLISDNNIVQVMPVSIATVLQQSPYILFYELQGIATFFLPTASACLYIAFYHTDEVIPTLSLWSCAHLPGSAWLNDDVTIQETECLFI